MTNSINLTDDQLHWLRVSVENSLEGAKRLAEAGNDEDDLMDGLLLVEKYTELQGIIGEPPANPRRLVPHPSNTTGEPCTLIGVGSRRVLPSPIAR